jgi:hypothetical protein
MGTLGLALVSAGLLHGSSPPPPPTPADPDVPVPPDCKGGCTLGAHDVPTISEPELHDLLRQYATDPMSEESVALETLLFHGAETTRFLAATPDLVLDDERRVFLERELARRHAWIEFRVVTESGHERFRLDPTRVPLDIKQHVQPTFSSLPPLELNGTVKRVGLFHLWTRF